MNHKEALNKINFDIEFKVSRIEYIERCFEFGDRSDAQEFIKLVKEVKELMALKAKIQALISSNAPEFFEANKSVVTGNEIQRRNHKLFVDQMLQDQQSHLNRNFCNF